MESLEGSVYCHLIDDSVTLQGNKETLVFLKYDAESAEELYEGITHLGIMIWDERGGGRGRGEGERDRRKEAEEAMRSAPPCLLLQFPCPGFPALTSLPL